MQDGYRGPVFASPATAALLGLLLPDSGRLEEEQAAYANEMGYSRHRPALPLYTEADARRSLELLQTVPFDEQLVVDDRRIVNVRLAAGASARRRNSWKLSTTPCSACALTGLSLPPTMSFSPRHPR